MDSYRKDLETLAPFLPHGEYKALAHYLAPGAEEREAIGETVSKWANTVKTMPHTYQQEKLGNNAIVHLHYFIGGSDFFITEKDKDGKGTEQAFGFSVLNGDLEMAELGYISIDEITEIGAELDLYWNPRPLADVKRELGL